MAKVPAYTLAWSPATAAYELYQTRDRQVLGIVAESPEWFAWLEQVSSFAFSGKSGHYTARKEAKQRGDRYWSAYLAAGEHLTKKYLTMRRMPYSSVTRSIPCWRPSCICHVRAPTWSPVLTSLNVSSRA
jgi:hypothetical protein